MAVLVHIEITDDVGSCYGPTSLVDFNRLVNDRMEKGKTKKIQMA